MFAPPQILTSFRECAATTQEEELARLYHIPIPKQTDLSNQLQHRAEPEGP
jgi:hypothetical protein